MALKFNDGDGEKEFLKTYLVDPDKVTFDKFCFIPPGSNRPVEGKFNLFTPWAGLDCALPPAPDTHGRWRELPSCRSTEWDPSGDPRSQAWGCLC